MDHLAGYDGENFICHPAYTAYALSGLDATVLGNHDFDAGLKTLEKAIAQDACFPVYLQTSSMTENSTVWFSPRRWSLSKDSASVLSV